jgi:serine/threonine protein kinase
MKRPPALAPGATFGRYAVLALLGRGGLGEVWRVRDTTLRREVALKIVRIETPEEQPSAATIDPSAGGDAGVGILRAARAAAAIEHPNVVSIFEVGESDGLAFFTMELIHGKTLRAWAPSAPLEARLRALAIVARALDAAHARGVLHRDVKPDNVMLRDDGVLKVLDFGIARRATRHFAGATSRARERWSVIAGTPRYMAPEQLRGEELDARCDQFAWGVTASEILDGELTPVVEAIVRRTREEKASARFASMGEVADALEAALGAAVPAPEEAPSRGW